MNEESDCNVELSNISLEQGELSFQQVISECKKALCNQLITIIQKYDAIFLSESLIIKFLKSTNRSGERMFSLLKELLHRAPRMRVILIESILKVRAIPSDINLLIAFSEKFDLIKEAERIWRLSETRIEIAGAKAKIIDEKRNEEAKKEFMKTAQPNKVKQFKTLSCETMKKFLKSYVDEYGKEMSKNKVHRSGTRDNLKKSIQKLHEYILTNVDFDWNAPLINVYHSFTLFYLHFSCLIM